MKFYVALSGRQLNERFLTQRDALGQDMMGFQPENMMFSLSPQRDALG